MTVHRCEWCGHGPIDAEFKICGRCAQMEAKDERANDEVLRESLAPRMLKVDRNPEESK